MAAVAASSSSATLTKSAGIATDVRPALSIDRVRLTDGTSIAINDHVYVSSSLAVGAGEPYIIARVMEFVDAAASDPKIVHNSRAPAASSSSTSDNRQVRLNIYSRQRDVTQRVLHDPRQLVATMLTETYPLCNIRGRCTVRHRDLIGDGSAVSAWKKQDDHFYFHQLNDTYLRRLYDVIPSHRIRNAPAEVLACLRHRYSFIVAEPGLGTDLCGPLRACATCNEWASSQTSVRCDTCKNYFHMDCLTPPLVSKPAKGYSWNCAPCSKKREKASDLPFSRTAAAPAINGTTMTSSKSSTGQYRSPNQDSPRDSLSHDPAALAGRGRGRPQGTIKNAKRGSGKRMSPSGRSTPLSELSREVTPSTFAFKDRATSDDERGTRCFNRWPYRYFGEHTNALDVLDPEDSIYPLATPRIGPKFQTAVISWQEQEALGLGVEITEVEASEPAIAVTEEIARLAKRPNGKGSKSKRAAGSGASTPDDTITASRIAVSTVQDDSEPMIDTEAPVASSPPKPPTPEIDFIRGEDDSVDVIWKPVKSAQRSMPGVFIKLALKHFQDRPDNLGLHKRALMLLCQCKGEPGRALSEFTASSDEELEIAAWTPKEEQQFEQAVRENDELDMKSMKLAVPSKTPAQIVRKFYAWQTGRFGKLWADQRSKDQKSSPDDLDSVLSSETGIFVRAVSPSSSVWNDANQAQTQPLQGQPVSGKVCKMCATTHSAKWYKGPFVWQNRRLCETCGLYWRKYAVDIPDIITRKREAQEEAMAAATQSKVAKLSKPDTVKSSGRSRAAASTIIPPPQPVKMEPGKCVFCDKKEPKARLHLCNQCSLSVHSGCYGIDESKLSPSDRDAWKCDPCCNESNLDAALLPSCILCADENRPFQDGKENAGPLTALDAYKPTECNNWSHVLCANYVNELCFTNPREFKVVEGVGNLPAWRYEKQCDLCDRKNGACVTCAEPTCKRAFHVSCAYRHGKFVFGVDVVPVKHSRRESIITAKFKQQDGRMAAAIYCDAHREIAEQRELISPHETERQADNVTLSALQVYAETHRAVEASIVPLSASMNIQNGAAIESREFALLRRAKRLDSAMFRWSGGEHAPVEARRNLTSSRLSARPSVKPERTEIGALNVGLPNGHHAASESLRNGNGYATQRSCLRCTTRFSPFWWALPSDAEEMSTEEGAGAWLHEYRKGKQPARNGTPGEGPHLCVRCRHSVLPQLTAA